MAQDNKLVIFIDGSNVYRSMKRFREHYKLDYSKLVDKLKGDRNLIRTYYYASTKIPPIQAQEDFHEMLEIRCNFRTIIKPLHGRGRDKREKGVDVALVTDFLSLGYKQAYDTAIIISGDQDYENAIQKVQDLGITVEVAGYKNSMGKQLLKCCDALTYLDDIASDIEM